MIHLAVQKQSTMVPHSRITSPAHTKQTAILMFTVQCDISFLIPGSQLTLNIMTALTLG